MLSYDGLKTARDSCCTWDTLHILANPIYEPYRGSYDKLFFVGQKNIDACQNDIYIVNCANIICKIHDKYAKVKEGRPPRKGAWKGLHAYVPKFRKLGNLDTVRCTMSVQKSA